VLGKHNFGIMYDYYDYLGLFFCGLIFQAFFIRKLEGLYEVSSYDKVHQEIFSQVLVLLLQIENIHDSL